MNINMTHVEEEVGKWFLNRSDVAHTLATGSSTGGYVNILIMIQMKHKQMKHKNQCLNYVL